MDWTPVAKRKGPTPSKASAPVRTTPRGFPIRYDSSYANPGFSGTLPEPDAQQPKKLGSKHPQRSRAFKKLPPPPPRPTFLYPRRGNHAAPKRSGYRIAIGGLHLGVLGRAGSTFESEYAPRLNDGHIDANEDARYLVITGEGFTSQQKTALHFRIIVAADSVESVLFDPDNFHLLLTLQFAPSFETHTTGPSMHDVARVTAFDSVHRQIAPYASRHILISLPSSSVLTPLVAVLAGLPISRPAPKQLSVDHQLLRYYSRDALLAFRASLSDIQPAYAFQLEGILHETLLLPTEFGEVFSAIEALDMVHGTMITERWLVEVRRLLELDRFRRTRREIMLDEGKVELELPPFDLGAILENARSAILDAREALDLIPDTDPHHFLCRHVSVTPSGLRFAGPFVEAGNSVVRKFPQAVPHLLRVSFTEEDGTRLQVGRWGVTKDFLTGSVFSTLSQSLDVCGRWYQFLAYSQSSLRSHTVWMTSPFWLEEIEDDARYDKDGEEIVSDMLDAEAIRSQLGDFSKLIYHPTLYGARLSQAFTSSRATISLRPAAIVSLEDIALRGKYDKIISNFTDGAGTMSYAVRDLIWTTMTENGHRRDRSAPAPSVFQIRLGGYKGIIVLDSELGGDRIGLRPSQRKFTAAYDEEIERSFVLHVAEAFTRPGRLHLNRPLVSALEDLGIKPSTFLDLQRRAVTDLLEEKATLVGAGRILARYMLGHGSRFQSLLSSFVKMKAVSPRILEDEPYLKALMDLVTSRVLRDIKHSAKIPLRGCWQVVGVPDLDDYLEPDEIYCVIRDEKGSLIHLQGRMAITRSPTLDAGDVRIVHAVGELPSQLRISSLVNCVVLSTRGTRAVASTMGGGDLDGDQYQIITIPELVPEEEVEPRGHEGVPHLRLPKPCTMLDVAGFFASFIENDNVGLAATTHLRIADSSPKGGHDPRCKELADLYSRAVDYQKTGVAVPLSDIPKLGGRRPDFLSADEHSGNSDKVTYPSQRALGQLYRAIPNHQVPLHPAPHDTSKDSTTSHFIQLRSNLLNRAWVEFGFKPLDLSVDIRPVTTRTLNAFCGELALLAETGNYPRRPGQSLSETEVFLGSIAAEALRQRKGAKDAATHLKFQVERLVDSVEELIGRDLSLGDQFSSAWACWDVALEAPESMFGVKSFRWICVALLCDTLDDIEDKGPTHRPQQPLIPPTPQSTNSSRVGTPSHSSTPVVGPPTLEPPRPPPRAVASGTKASRKKDRLLQAQKLQAELSRIQSIPEGGEGDDDGWEIKRDYGPKRTDDEWPSAPPGLAVAPAPAPAPAPVVNPWSSAGRGGARDGRGRGESRSVGRGGGREGSNVAARPPAWGHRSSRPSPSSTQLAPAPTASAARPPLNSSPSPAPVNGWIASAPLVRPPAPSTPAPPSIAPATSPAPQEIVEIGWDEEPQKEETSSAAWWD